MGNEILVTIGSNLIALLTILGFAWAMYSKLDDKIENVHGKLDDKIVGVRDASEAAHTDIRGQLCTLRESVAKMETNVEWLVKDKRDTRKS
ncbi:MAG: hypothetical protein OXG09_06210 [Chloroflexi bacterium]|nr:hypothetical protein [Chloroflexota bacterium]